MFSEHDTEYFKVRAEQERLRAERATHTCAQTAHRELAELYDQRCNQPENTSASPVLG